MQLSKHHGLGNDFLVALTDEVPDLGAHLARAWCHRTHGIGADGLIFGTPVDDADLRMTLFNSDGSRAEISGNGIRCLAQAAFSKVGGNELSIVTDGGLRHLELIAAAGNEAQIGVEMGDVTLDGDEVDLDRVHRPAFQSLRAMTGSVGNPHVVIEVDDIDAVDPSIDGPAIEAFWKPEGINVHFLSQTAPESIRLVHWERGAGVTEACGSGATVSSTVANHWGMVPGKVHVAMPGGAADVVVGSPARLLGPAVHVADITIAEAV